MPVQRFLCKDAASFTTVKIIDMGSPRNGVVLELHPDLHVFEYTNRYWLGANGFLCRSLRWLPPPSELREFSFLDDVHRPSEDWFVEREGPFAEPDLTRLVDTVQVSSLVKLSLERVRFVTDEESSRFARGLAASPVKDLCLLLFTDNARIYRHIVSALSTMPHLESLKAGFALDGWGEDTKTVGSFSIPVGDIVRGASNLKSLEIGQCWKLWDEVQCRDLAMAIQEPSCELKIFDIFCYNNRLPMELAGVAPIMPGFLSPPSLIEDFSFSLWNLGSEEDIDAWLSALPKTTALRSLKIYVLGYDKLTSVQEETLLSIVSGWYHITDMTVPGEEGAHYGFVEKCVSDDFRLQLLTLLRLNKAGRHYLTSPTPSKADGVKVLIKVRDELNDIYTHLLENPCLCDRGVATPTAGRTPSPMPKKPRHS